jgi:hypothetical protein
MSRERGGREGGRSKSYLASLAIQHLTRNWSARREQRPDADVPRHPEAGSALLYHVVQDSARLPWSVLARVSCEDCNDSFSHSPDQLARVKCKNIEKIDFVAQAARVPSGLWFVLMKFASGRNVLDYSAEVGLATPNLTPF